MRIPQLQRKQVESFGRSSTAAVGRIASAVGAKSSAETQMLNQLAKVGGEFIRQEEKAKFQTSVVNTQMSELDYVKKEGAKEFFTGKELEGRVDGVELYDTKNDENGKEIRIPKQSIPAYQVYPQLLTKKLRGDMETQAQNIPNPIDRQAFIDQRSIYINNKITGETLKAAREQYTYLRNENDAKRKQMLSNGNIEGADFLASDFNGTEFEIADRLQQNLEAKEVWDAERLIQYENKDGIESMLAYLEDKAYKEKGGPLPERKNNDVQTRLRSKLHSLNIRQDSGNKIYRAEIKQAGQDMENALENGNLRSIETVGRMMGNLQSVGLNDLAIDLRRANELAPFVDQMKKRPTAEHKPMIDQYVGDKKSDKAIALRDKLLRMSEKYNARVEKDATGFYEELNISKRLVPKQPGFFTQSLQVAKKAGVTYGVKAKPLSDVNADVYAREIINATMPEKIQLINTVLGETKNKSERDAIFKQIDAKNAGNLNVYADILERKEGAVLTLIEDGRKYRQDPKLKLLPPNTASKANVALNMAFPLNAEREQYTEAVLDLYAAMAYKDGDIDKAIASPKRLENAIKLVVGNVVEYRGRKLLLPNNDIDSDGFNRWVNTMGPDFINSLGGADGITDSALTKGLRDGDIRFEPTEVRGEYNLLDINKNYLRGADGLPFILPYVRIISKRRTGRRGGG